jgi:hypothetical protein
MFNSNKKKRNNFLEKEQRIKLKTLFQRSRPQEPTRLLSSKPTSNLQLPNLDVTSPVLTIALPMPLPLTRNQNALINACAMLALRKEKKYLDLPFNLLLPHSLNLNHVLPLPQFLSQLQFQKLNLTSSLLLHLNLNHALHPPLFLNQLQSQKLKNLHLQRL